MKKKNLIKLTLKKKVISDLTNTKQIFGGKEKSIHETNCNQCPPTNSNACPSANNDCVDDKESNYLLCTASCYITCIFC